MRIATAALACVLALSAEQTESWLDVPFVQQVEAGCGSAAIAMLMQYWQAHDHDVDARAADATRINAVLKPDRKRGVWGAAMKQYLDRNGFSAFVFNGEMQDLRTHTAKGRPVVVALAPSGEKAPYHFVIVAGISGDYVYFNDPARGRLMREKLQDFERSWKITDGWSLLAVPRKG